ncbi:MAG: AmmeMemoRadiSam system protein B [Candidatus Cloacimonadales bacterium]|nr:AmmeMemoRadiSam system protein B [Candidatus Cloacimonadales bacterium]
MKRKPIVAGSFYPGITSVLANDIDHYLSNVQTLKKHNDILGITVPHAGYFYSGQCAAYGFKAIQHKDFEVAVIIAPSHRYGHFRFSAGNFESYLTPLGEVEVDQQMVEKLLTYDDFQFIPAAHNSEHSLEVQLPFLQVVKPSARIVPILVGNQTFENSERLANILQQEFADRLDKTIFIISTDLSHYYEGRIAEKMDSIFAANLAGLNIQRLEKELENHKCEACGMGGVLTLMHLAEKLNYGKAEILNYTHSGKTTGDDSQVVGYLSALVYK